MSIVVHPETNTSDRPSGVTRVGVTGAATDGVTPFFLALCKVITILAVVSSQPPPSDVVCTEFFLNSSTFFKFHSGVTPWMVSPVAVPPSDATGQTHSFILFSPFALRQTSAHVVSVPLRRFDIFSDRILQGIETKEDI